ncbi:MAG: hypothetical protein Q9219_006645 [cf. Caloplaca sp. 3 TL-2023]
MSNPCTICLTPNAQLCGKCHSAAYCSIECQQTDWATHKLLCTQFSVLAPRPGPSFRRVFLFPDEGPNPIVFWMDHEIGKEWMQLRKITNFTIPKRVLCTHNDLRDLDFEGTLHFNTDAFTQPDAVMNKSILLVTKGKPAKNWTGPIVVQKSMDVDPADWYGDVTMTDFRNVVDFFMEYRGPVAYEETYPLKHKAKGVKVNCYGDIRRLGRKFVDVEVPKDHPVFLANPSPMSELVGMPVKARKYPFDKYWDTMPYQGCLPWSNGTAAFLHLRTDPVRANGWGWAPAYWQNSVGNMLVVRADKKDITPAEVETLCDFCQFKMQPLFHNTHEAEDFEAATRTVLSFLTPAAFRKYAEEEHRSDAIDELRKEWAKSSGYDLPPLEQADGNGDGANTGGEAIPTEALNNLSI